MTVSLRADLSGLEAGLRRAQELVARSAARLTEQERRFGAAVGESAWGLSGEWRAAWQAMDAAAETALRRMTRRVGRGIAEMIVEGRGLRDFWRELWRDLVEIAVQRLLQLVLQARSASAALREIFSSIGGGLFAGLFGGLGLFSLLGFDNPRNDAWARKQGFDFARHFRAGVAAALALPFGELAPTLSPALAGAGIGALRGAALRAVSIQPGAFVVQVSAQTLDERTVRSAGALLADEVSRRLGWSDRRRGV